MPTDARQMEQKSSTGENYTDYNLRNRACSQSMFSLKKKVFKSHSLRQKFLTKERGATEKGGNGHSRVPLDTLMLHCNCSPEMFENLFGENQALETTTEFTIFIKFHNKIKRLCAFFYQFKQHCSSNSYR